jgi:hypothetical protein
VGRGTGPTGAEIWSVIDKLPQGNSSFVREIRSAQDLQRLWEWMKQAGDPIKNPYKGTGKGVEFYLHDGTRIGQRTRGDSTGMPTLDTHVAGKDYVRIHINPRGGVPEIASAPRFDAEAPRPLLPTDSPSARGGGAPRGALGGGVLPDNTLPHFIEPPQTKQNPVIGDGRPDPEP